MTISPENPLVKCYPPDLKSLVEQENPKTSAHNEINFDDGRVCLAHMHPHPKYRQAITMQESLLKQITAENEFVNTVSLAAFPLTAILLCGSA